VGQGRPTSEPACSQATIFAEAKAWAARRPKNAPEPTAYTRLHPRGVKGGGGGDRVLNASSLRRWLRPSRARDGPASSREPAQTGDDGEDQKYCARGSEHLCSVAVWLGWRAEQQRKVAEEQREQVDQSLYALEDSFSKTLAQHDIATLKEVFAVYQMGADHGDANSMENLGMLYAQVMAVARIRQGARMVREGR